MLTSQLNKNKTKEILNKDRDGKASLFVMLLVILLERFSMLLGVVTPSSSSPSWREFIHKFLNPTSRGERSHTLKELLML